MHSCALATFGKKISSDGCEKSTLLNPMVDKGGCFGHFSSQNSVFFLQQIFNILQTYITEGTFWGVSISQDLCRQINHSVIHIRSDHLPHPKLVQFMSDVLLREVTKHVKTCQEFSVIVDETAEKSTEGSVIQFKNDCQG